MTTGRLLQASRYGEERAARRISIFSPTSIAQRDEQPDQRDEQPDQNVTHWSGPRLRASVSGNAGCTTPA
jgi:hypothetical protein